MFVSVCVGGRWVGGGWGGGVQMECQLVCHGNGEMCDCDRQTLSDDAHTHTHARTHSRL